MNIHWPITGNMKTRTITFALAAVMPLIAPGAFAQDAPPLVKQINNGNWLPAPKGHFSLYIRAYWGKEGILDGSCSRRW